VIKLKKKNIKKKNEKKNIKIFHNFASDLVIFGMLHRNGPSMQVGKYFSCLLGNAVPN